MRTRILVAIGGLLLVCVVIGVIGALSKRSKNDATATAKSAQAATMAPTQQVVTKPTPTAKPTKPTPTVKPTTTPKPPAATANADALTAQVKAFAESHFGGSNPVAWYPKATKLFVNDHSVVVNTSLEPTTADKQLAAQACQNLSAFVFNNENKALGLNEVIVSGVNPATGQDNVPLVDRKGLSGTCDPLP